jgi:hypothetical protein
LSNKRNAWVELSKPEYAEVWEKFYDRFQFAPSTTKFPGILEPIPSVTYFLGYDLWPESDVDHSYNNMLKAFQTVLPSDGRMYALDWQPTCYRFHPYHFDGMWRVGLPDGDYAIFLAEDFSLGFFRHPWEATICIFGEPLLEAFQKYPPRLFEKVVRKDGKPV